MKLTPAQTEQLFLFTKKKMVHYYDLQVELVDHLANMIEDLTTENPSLDFDAALKKAYSSFGLFGFAHIVQEKEKHLFARYKKMWWKEMVNQFKWPEIMLSAIILILTWTLVRYININILGSCFLAGWIVCQYMQTKMMRQARNNGKALLMLQYHPMTNSLFLFLLQFTGWSFIYSASPYLATAVFVSGFLIEIATFRMLSRVSKEARKMFPEAFVATT